MSGIEGTIEFFGPVNTNYVNQIVAGNGITVSGTSNLPVVSVSQSVIDSATNAVKSVTGGTNINITGTATDPIVNVTGVVNSVTASTNVSITGTATDPIVNVTAGGGSILGFYYNNYSATFTPNANIGNWTLATASGTTLMNDAITAPVGYTSFPGWDTTGGSFNPVTGVWTVPQTGYWQISYCIGQIQSSSPQKYINDLILFMNDTTQEVRYQNYTSWSWAVWKSSFTQFLTQNDSCRLYWQATTPDPVEPTEVRVQMFFCVRFISDP